MLSVDVMSQAMPRPPNSAATAFAPSPLRSSTVTFAPRRASSRAVSAPSPEAPPVTSATCPSIFMVSLPSGGSVDALRASRPAQARGRITSGVASA
jgi:hypothetical protein